MKAVALEPRPVRLAWPIVAGDDESLTVVIKDIDTTDRTYTCQIRTAATADDIAATATVAAVLVGTDTEITITLTDAQTRTLGDTGRTRYVYDLQEDAAGVISTLVGGTVVVSQDVTR